MVAQHGKPDPAVAAPSPFGPPTMYPDKPATQQTTSDDPAKEQQFRLKQQQHQNTSIGANPPGPSTTVISGGQQEPESNNADASLQPPGTVPDMDSKDDRVRAKPRGPFGPDGNIRIDLLGPSNQDTQPEAQTVTNKRNVSGPSIEPDRVILETEAEGPSTPTRNFLRAAAGYFRRNPDHPPDSHRPRRALPDHEVVEKLVQLETRIIESEQRMAKVNNYAIEVEATSRAREARHAARATQLETALNEMHGNMGRMQAELDPATMYRHLQLRVLADIQEEAQTDQIWEELGKLREHYFECSFEDETDSLRKRVDAPRESSANGWYYVGNGIRRVATPHCRHTVRPGRSSRARSAEDSV